MTESRSASDARLSSATNCVRGAALLADLPPHDPRPSSAPGPRLDAGGPADHLRAYLVVMVALVAIWALTGAGYFWPVWPALGWGIGLVPQILGAQRPRPGS